MVSKFDDRRERLKNELLEMTSLVEAGIRGSMLALVERNRAAAEDVCRSEGRINAIEMAIDQLAIDLLALHQPMATDLRFIIASLKINTNLERMGDLAVSIAHSALGLIDGPNVKPVIDLPLLAGLVQSMVRKSMDAYVAGDAELAQSVLESDDEVDALYAASHQRLVEFMQLDSANVKPTLDLLVVIRTLERLADHATNIAEDVLFYVKGVDVRHNSLAQKLSGQNA